MEVPPVDQRHFDGRAPQSPGGVQAAESSADNDHTMRHILQYRDARTPVEGAVRLRRSEKGRRVLFNSVQPESRHRLLRGGNAV